MSTTPLESIRNLFHLNISSRVLLKRVWFACAFFSLIYILISIINGDDNHKSKHGTKALGFTALWSAGMVLLVMIASGVVVFYGKTSAHIIGLLIGVCAMLTQLLFVIMIVFFVYSEHANTSGHDLKSSDRAMGSFALFLMLTMGTWTTVLWFCKDEIISNRQSLSQSDTQPLQQHHFSKSSSSSSSTTIPSAPPASVTTLYSAAPSHQEELPLHQQDDVVDVDLEDEETF